ncbi:MAG: encapsulin-associated ferritin-like protein, partial [Spirochaetia bacterium]
MSDYYHEPVEDLDEKTRNYTRALNSIKEEIDAIDWYNQRVVASKDPELKKVMAHNRDEEIEHAVMTLEWVRRNFPEWNDAMKTYLFTEKPITEIEEDEDTGDETSGSGDLGIGSLKK